MRHYRVAENKKIDKVICNKCGKEIVIQNGRLEGDVLEVSKRWGYASETDNEVHSFDLCEACYDELVSTFQIPPTIEE